MRALRVVGGVTTLDQDHLEPRPNPGDAIVAVQRAGVCRTDLELAKGYMGFEGTLGHEFVGIVTEAPDGREWIGRRVVGEINFGCGACDWCAGGIERHCPHRAVLGIQGADGALAEMVRVPLRNLHAVPDRVANDEAVFVEPLAAAYEILDQVTPAHGSRVTVLGDGKLGALVALVLAAHDCRVRVVGRHPDKLERLRAIGLDTGDPEPGAHIVVDASGSPDGLAQALTLVRPRGTIVLKTTVASSHTIDLSRAVIDEISIQGSRCGRFAPALSALANGSIDVRPLIDALVPLSDGRDVLSRAASRNTFKVLVDPSR